MDSMSEEHNKLVRELITRIRYDQVRAEAFKETHKEWDVEKGTLVILYTDDAFTQISSLNDRLAVQASVEKMRADGTYIFAIVDVGSRFLKTLKPIPQADTQGSPEPREDYFYSPVTARMFSDQSGRCSTTQ